MGLTPAFLMALYSFRVVCVRVVLQAGEGQESQNDEATRLNETEASGIFVLMAASGAFRSHGRGDSTYYEPEPTGCERMKSDKLTSTLPYQSVCKGLSNDEWECTDRTLATDGTGKHSDLHGNHPNDNLLCPSFVACSCSKKDWDAGAAGYNDDMCSDLHGQLKVNHDEYLSTFKNNICPSWIEGCTDSGAADCSVEKCLQGFPRYFIDVGPRVYSKNAQVGCWTRLARSGKRGVKVFSLIADYESLAKCCYQDTSDGPKYKWLQGSELVTSKRPWKWIQGKRSCPKKQGWHSAHNHKKYDDVDTQDKCERL
jgi:hypothetical protein